MNIWRDTAPDKKRPTENLAIAYLWMEEELLRRVVHGLHTGNTGRDGRGHALALQTGTRREAEILKLIAAGLTNREIADQLVISPETVKKHAGNIYGKLNVASRTEAVAVARDLDLLD